MTKKKEVYRCYSLERPIKVNEIKFWEIVISSHYEEKHPEITDKLILELVQQLDNKIFVGKAGKEGWKYFEFEPLFHQSKTYRLVWCWNSKHSFLGIRNCFQRKKYEK
jgi:hypothetical protein